MADEVATSITDSGLVGQIQPFLDEWYYRILSCPVGKTWQRQKAFNILLDVLAMIGIDVPAASRDSIFATEDDTALVEAIIAAMPAEYRMKFEATALQLQTVLHESTRILAASEEPGDDAIGALFDEADSTRGGLPAQVLKASIVYAAKEVAVLRRVHTSWRRNTDARIDRLVACAEEAEHCQQQLMAAENQLHEYRGDAKDKGKSMLMNMANGKESALKHSVFSGWLGYVTKVKTEQEIRQRFQGQIDLCQQKLVQYKEAKIANIRGVLMRGAMQETEVLMHFVWKTWVDDVAERKAEGDTAGALKAAQDRLAEFEKSQKGKAAQFMTRMAAGNEASLKNLCLEAWIKFHNDYAADREMEERVKAAEAAFKAHMDAKKDEAKTVMNRMLAGSDQGLMAMIWTNWTQYIKDEKAERELNGQLEASAAKFKSLNARQKQGASNVQNRVNEQIKANLMQRCLNNWMIETKISRVDSHYNAKYDSKRRQLAGVQNLFKSFALQLEQNLGQDDDSSNRTNRTNKRSSRHRSEKKLNKGADGSVSLPDIHQKTSPVAAS